MKNFLCILFLSLCFISFEANALDYIPNDVLQEANRILKDEAKFALTDPAMLRDYGFDAQEQLEQLTVGEGIPARQIDFEKLTNLANKKLNQVVTEQNTYWSFVIYYNDQPKTIMAIRKENGIYKFAGLGGKPTNLLLALAEAEKYAKNKNQDINPYLLSMGSDFFIDPQLQNDDSIFSVLNNSVENQKITILNSKTIINQIRKLRELSLKRDPKDPIQYGNFGLFDRRLSFEEKNPYEKYCLATLVFFTVLLIIYGKYRLSRKSSIIY